SWRTYRPKGTLSAPMVRLNSMEYTLGLWGHTKFLYLIAANLTAVETPRQISWHPGAPTGPARQRPSLRTGFFLPVSAGSPPGSPGGRRAAPSGSGAALGRPIPLRSGHLLPHPLLPAWTSFSQNLLPQGAAQHPQ